MALGFFLYVSFLETCEKKILKVFMVNHATKNPWVKMKEKSNSGQGHKIVKRIKKQKQNNNRKRNTKSTRHPLRW